MVRVVISGVWIVNPFPAESGMVQENYFNTLSDDDWSRQAISSHDIDRAKQYCLRMALSYMRAINFVEWHIMQNNIVFFSKQFNK